MSKEASVSGEGLGRLTTESGSTTKSWGGAGVRENRKDEIHVQLAQ